MVVREIKENAHKGENSVSLLPNHSISERDTLSRRDSMIIESIAFRDKRLGWKKFSFALTLAKATADGKKNSVSLSYMHENDPYFLGFNDYNLYLRPSCMKCPIRDLRSGSDITLADFWGIETLLPELDDDKGISVVMVNTEKGLKLLNTLDLHLHDVQYSDIVLRNSSVQISSIVPSTSLFDVLKYKKYLPNKRAYYFNDKQHSVSEKVRILGRPSLYSIIRQFIGRTYRKLFNNK